MSSVSVASSAVVYGASHPILSMKPTVWIAEDDPALIPILRYNLEAQGYAVQVATRGDELDLWLRERMPDLLVLDWMLPGISGIEMCRRIRNTKATEHLPILMLTARGEESDRVRGFQTGADDYVVKPFFVPELLQRIKALLRRSDPARFDTQLRKGDITLDRTARRVFRNGIELHLGPTEFRLLEYLVVNAGKVFSREHLLNQVWGMDVYIDERTVDVHVGRLRKALHQEQTDDPIRTVRGSGYSFEERAPVPIAGNVM
jgi:two-component system, OmpR family, phosphate regulon response regulator PhoB